MSGGGAESRTTRVLWGLWQVGVALIAGALFVGACGGALAYLGGSHKDMGDLYLEAPVVDPATSAYPGRAEGVSYEGDVGDDVGATSGVD